MATKEGMQQAPVQEQEVLKTLRQAKIERITPPKMDNEQIKRQAMQQLFAGFYRACEQVAKNQGTAIAFASSQMKQFFG